ncbi:MAG: hydroxysqualene dehydroxylase HpnE [Dehalococcoidia bacterium]
MDGNNAQGSAAPRQVIVVGGGLAGISAACELADLGHRVTLLEKRPFLGGRTYSFVDKKLGAEVDNGQHIFMKCCTFYIALLKKLGVLHKTYLQPRLRLDVFNGQRQASALFSSLLPAPLHLLPSFLRYRHLTWRDKLGIARAAFAMRRLSEAQRTELDGISFYDWLADHGQSDQAVEAFWDLIILPVCNDNSRRVSASQAIMVFQDAFLTHRHAADIGYATVGLSTLLADEAKRYVEERGGAVMLGTSLECLEGDQGGIQCARLYSRPPLKADAYVLAVPPRQLGKLLSPALRQHEFFDRASRLAMSPIVNVHLWFDRRVTDLEFAAFLENEVQWVFNKTAIYRRDGDQGQHLCISLSGAHKFIDMPKDELYRLVTSELQRAIPQAREASVTRFIVMRERYATFSPRPGSAAYRLPTRTPTPNLFLAGAWTDTGWPSTMESAVRSGVFAAREIARTP